MMEVQGALRVVKDAETSSRTGTDNATREAMTKSVLLVEPHQVCRTALSAIINGAGVNLEALDQAGTAEEAMELIASSDFDVIVFSVGQPHEMRLLKEIVRLAPESNIVVLALSGDDGEVAYEAARAGAVGFIPKSADPGEIVSVLSEAADGKVSFHPSASLAGLMFAASRQHPERVRDPLTTLTPRENDIYALLLEGTSTKAIASALFLSRRTVEFHLSSIYRKLGVKGRIEALRVFSGASGRS